MKENKEVITTPSDPREQPTITIEFTQELLDQWLVTYFKRHPRAHKIPITTPAQPSLNIWTILPRISMNTLKQNYKDYVNFVIKSYGLEMLGISKCKVTYKTFVATKTRIDLDNTTPKQLLDSFSSAESGVIVDDGYSCITSLTLLAEYRKGQKGSVLIFSECEYDKKLLMETREKELAKSAKRKATTLDNKLKKKNKKYKKR